MLFNGFVLFDLQRTIIICSVGKEGRKEGRKEGKKEVLYFSCGFFCSVCVRASEVYYDTLQIPTRSLTTSALCPLLPLNGEAHICSPPNTLTCLVGRNAENIVECMKTAWENACGRGRWRGRLWWCWW